MKILFFGDVFGKPGRDAVKSAIVKLSRQDLPDFIVINGENVAHGKGITEKFCHEFFEMGVDVITTGNHAWDQPDSAALFAKKIPLIRPLNYPDPNTPGVGSIVVSSRQQPSLKLAVIQVMGRVFMDPLDCPFWAAEREVERLKKMNVKHILIDFHGEATSEKQAFQHFMDGKVSAVFGTHSHVQTADERILKGGTAVITDVGMSGCFDSVIGVKKEVSIKRFTTKRPVKFEPAEGPGGYGAVMVEVNAEGRAIEIKRFREEVVHNEFI